MVCVRGVHTQNYSVLYNASTVASAEYMCQFKSKTGVDFEE